MLAFQSNFVDDISMKATLKPDCLKIDITIEECMRVREGGQVADRINPLDLEAKIEVYSLEQSGDPELVRRATVGKGVAQILGNNDILLFAPAICFEDVRFSRVDFKGEDITSPAGEEFLEHWRQRIPGQLICLMFGGSLNIIDLYSYFETPDSD